jgi:hypothetical protein
MRSLLAILIVLLSALLTPGCASTVPGQPPPASVTAQAATVALVAYRDVIRAGGSRADARVAARDAAIAEAVRLTGALPESYRPYIDLALLAMEVSLAKSDADESQRVALTIEKAVAEAEARRLGR